MRFCWIKRFMFLYFNFYYFKILFWKRWIWRIMKTILILLIITNRCSIKNLLSLWKTSLNLSLIEISLFITLKFILRKPVILRIWNKIPWKLVLSKSYISLFFNKRCLNLYLSIRLTFSKIVFHLSGHILNKGLILR